MVSRDWTKIKSFVTNFQPDVDVERWVRIAKTLGMPAWIGDSVGGMDGMKGFYIHHAVGNLTHFWDIVYVDNKERVEVDNLIVKWKKERAEHSCGLRLSA